MASIVFAAWKSAGASPIATILPAAIKMSCCCSVPAAGSISVPP
jgi:hypothetical protein